MGGIRVLIVEDDMLIAADVEEALVECGCEVCGVAHSQILALVLAERTKPDFAVVDVELAPGDGRIVAKELADRYGTAVLFATGHSADLEALARCGARGCLPKPYHSDEVMPALLAMRDIRAGRASDASSGRMIVLTP